MKPINVRLQNAYEQSGIERNPIIKWEYGQEDAGKWQISYQIKIFNEKNESCLDTGKIVSAEQNNIELEMKLLSHSRYEIVVGVEDDSGNVEWSDRVSFLSGIHREDWIGKWIGAASDKPFFAGKEFELRNHVKAVYLSVCGLGQFEAKLNEQKVGSGCLYGSWTDYNKRLHYWTFDVSDLCRMGKNQFSVEVGNGWYIGDTSEDRHFYTFYHRYEPFGTELTCKCQFCVVYEDGTREVFGTDEAWGTWKSAITMTNVYGSEDYDARKECTWDELFLHMKQNPVKVLCADEMPKGKLCPALYPPVKVIATYEPVSVIEVRNGCYLYDLGQNMAGVFEVAASGDSGTVLKITPAEKLDSCGNPLPTVNTWSSFTLKGTGKPEIFCPRFSYAAGRWIQVEVINAGDIKNTKIWSVRGHFVSTGARNAGLFQCSDKRYEQIHDLIKRAVESNLNHIHTDCPTIEKMGWLEPNHLMGPSVMYLKDVETIWSKIADDMRDAQYEEGEQDVDTGEFAHLYEEGLIPSVAPRYAKFITDCGVGSFWDITPWGSSLLLAVDVQRQFYGSKKEISKNYNAAKRYVEYLWKKYEAYPEIYKKSEEIHFLCHGLGDWGTDLKEGECRENVETAYLYKDLCVLKQWAHFLHDEETEQLSQNRAQRLCSHYNQLLLQKDQSGKWYYREYSDTNNRKIMGNQALPLYFGMVPKECEQDVKENFLKMASDGRIHSGEICLRYIFMLLASYGKNSLIEKMIMQKEHPSYYRFIKKGETTLPEFWSDDSRSRNHDMMGHILEWFYSEIGGIRSDDGFKTVTISPHLVGEMTEMKCSYYSVAGKIEVHVKIEQGEKVLHVIVPPNVKAVIDFPQEKG